MLVDLLTTAVLVVVAVRLAGAARLALRPEVRAHIGELVRGLRLRHLLPAPVVLTAVAAAAAGLLQVPGLDWGWWTAIGGLGNPVTGTTGRTVGTPLEWALPLVFLTLLVPALPLFAEAEERIFRAGAETWGWPRRLARSVVGFGLVHAVVGVPLGVALALSIGGAYFLAVYLRAARRHGTTAGVRESTRAHLAYNGVIVALLLATMLAVALDALTG